MLQAHNQTRNEINECLHQNMQIWCPHAKAMNAHGQQKNNHTLGMQVQQPATYSAVQAAQQSGRILTTYTSPHRSRCCADNKAHTFIKHKVWGEHRRVQSIEPEADPREDLRSVVWAGY